MLIKTVCLSLLFCLLNVLMIMMMLVGRLLESVSMQKGVGQGMDMVLVTTELLGDRAPW